MLFTVIWPSPHFEHPHSKTLVVWASLSHITLVFWIRVRVTGDAYITRVLGMRMPKMWGCPYHRVNAMFVYDRGTEVQQFRRLVMSGIHSRRPWQNKFEFSFVRNDHRSSQKSGMCRGNINVPDPPDVSPIIPDNPGYLRFRVFFSWQNLGYPGNRKNPQLPGIFLIYENQALKILHI